MQWKPGKEYFGYINSQSKLLEDKTATLFHCLNEHTMPRRSERAMLRQAMEASIKEAEQKARGEAETGQHRRRNASSKSARSKTPAKKKKSRSKSATPKTAVAKKTSPDKKFPVSSFVRLVIWIGLGTLWYKWNCNWAFSKSFYYASQAGLNVGFGLYSESPDCSAQSKLFTSAYCLFGVHAGSSALREVVFYLVKMRFEASRYLYLFLATTWIAVGLGYAMQVMKFDFADSVYFSVTALTTSGMLGPNDSMEQPLFFTSFFIFLGVPILEKGCEELSKLLERTFGK
jgi:hypothetical protein